MSYKTIAKIFIFLFAINIIYIEGSEPVLFVALENSDGLISLDLNNGKITVIVDALGNPAIDYHTRLGLLYYTDLNTRALSRIRYPPNGNTASPEIIIQAEDDHRPSAVAVDSINNLIYWADDYADSITKADLCGLNQYVILQDSSINNILGMALDVENSVIYFTDNGAGKIEKIGLDGSNRQTLYSNADYPNLIYLDIKEQKLYWTNTGSQNIQSMTSDGKDVKTVISYSHYPYGIDGYNGYIYWSQSRNGIIKRADKSGGSTSSWYHTRPYGVVGVKVYDGGNVSPTEHVCTTEGLSSVIIQTTTQDGGNISATEHVQTTTKHVRTTAKDVHTTVEHVLTTAEHLLTTVEYVQTTTKHVRTTAEDVHTTVEHVLTTAEHVLTTAEHVHTTAHNLRTSTESVRTTEGLSSIITIFQTIQDDKKSVLTIVLVIVLLVFSIVVIGLMYSKVKSNNTRIENGNRECEQETTTRPKRIFRPTIDVNRFRRERYQHEDQRIERHDAQVRISRTQHEDPKIEKQVWMERDRIRGDLQIYFLDF